MRFKIFTGIGLFFLLFETTAQGQFKRLTLRSDFPAKTAVVSNINQELGKKSPFLVAAAVNENGSQIEYRSLLQFNYDYLPDIIKTDPQMISSAHLVLFPANSDVLKNNPDGTNKLVVRRIINNWYDSLIAWDNQPVVDTSMIATEKVRIKKKDWQISVDVTRLFLDMLRHGNMGFMISQNSPVVPESLSGVSFASSLNEDKLLRPLLVIVYNDGSNTSSPSAPQRPDRGGYSPYSQPQNQSGGGPVRSSGSSGQ
jgi:hypothetical protein